MGHTQEETAEMNTWDRMNVYARSGRPRTAAQRRRLVKKAGTDPSAVVERDNGMGYPPAMQGYRELLGVQPTPDE